VPAPRKYPNELRERAQRMVAEAMAEDPGLTLNAAVKRIGPRVGIIPDTPVEVLRRPVEPGQYTAIRYANRLLDAGALASIGSVGDSYDNALAETIIGLYKAELIRRRGPWKGIDQVEYATLEWVDWFNHRRLLEPIGHVPPAEFEAAYHRQEDPSDPARLKHPSLR
jgi:putative transposase